ncbi:transcription elongation factor NusA [Fervidicoccus fontis]|uniref:Transcription elongation factor NusA n=1 Tax=Fervidicoccus fontis TaxID=683846 RepID=A0A843ACJ8_9CREN|nr:transcription elongation factor NusA [Fervidicoccus fontis]MBE9391724.1 transcription elongation factor NusA [Fervidicoccus fontis]PMB76356.1 MAG: transcription elongation factor NusA [Fervidicoccus fontis]
MKIPLDYICVKTGVLCPRCQRLVDSGKVDKKEIPVMKALIELEEEKEFKFLKDLNYIRTIWSEDLCVIVVKSDTQSQYQLKKVAKALSEKLNVRVQIVEDTRDLKKLASELLSPVRIVGVNTIWLPDGTTEYVIRISKYDARALPTKVEVLEDVFHKLFKSPAKIKME